MAKKKKSRAERKTPPSPPVHGGSRLLWYALALAVGTLLVMGLLNRGPLDVPIAVLVNLAKQGAPDKNPAAAVEVFEGPEGNRYRVRYSELAEIRIGRDEITGKITRLVLDPQQQAKPQRKAFRSSRYGLGGDTDAMFFDLFANAGFSDFRAEDAPGLIGSYGLLLLLVAPMVLLLLFAVRRLGGPGSAIAFGRSRGRFYAQEEIGVTFEDVAGLDEAVEELREVVEFLKKPEKYRVLGGRIPKGVLLVGPPGTGKTLLAKAIAGEASVPFFSLSGSDFVEMFVGVGAARVRDMFEQAKSRAPCIVFIDELDALGKARGTSVVGGHDEREQTLNALLVEMDGFASNSGVIVMAATNRPETLDPALLRPGRFDRHVLVDRPDVRGREAILRVHIKDVKVDPQLDLKEIASITPGFVGADLAALVNEAALLAARKNKKQVGKEEFTEAVERITAGLEKRQRVMSPEEKRRVAYHESAHALVASCLPNADPVHKVSIIPRGLAALGYTLQRPEGDRYLLTRSELESRIKVLLAGTVAEELIFQDTSTGAQNDLEHATEIARSMVMDFGMSRLGRVTFRDGPRSPFLNTGGEYFRPRLHSEQTAREIDEEIRRIVNEALQHVRDLLESRRPALEAIAARLMEKEVVDTEELRLLIEGRDPDLLLEPTPATPEVPRARRSRGHSSDSAASA